MTLAILCSGQGPQHSAMFALTGDAPAAAPLFAEAAALLKGTDPRALVRDANPASLTQNRVGQLLCTLQPLAAVAALGDALPACRIVAGYSVGEIAAWSVAGLLRADDALRLAARRAEAMDAKAEDGDGLLFIRGLDRTKIDQLCEQHGTAVAIVNPGDAFVLGGSGPELDAVAEAARAAGAGRIVEVGVRVASHTPRLAEAARTFRRDLDTVTPSDRLPSGVRLLSGIDAAPVVDVTAGFDKLAAQIAQTVRWADCLEACLEDGARAALELGPGRALSEMAAQAFPDLNARSLDDFKTLDGARRWLARIET